MQKGPEHQTIANPDSDLVVNPTSPSPMPSRPTRDALFAFPQLMILSLDYISGLKQVLENGIRFFVPRGM